MNPIVIGFGHKARHGKNTAAEHIAKTFGSKYTIGVFAFADEMKSELYDALLAPLHSYWETNRDYLLLPHPDNPFVSRQEKIAWIDQHKWMLGKHFQWYGTEFRRTADPFYWVKRLATTVKDNNPKIALITDVRFPNELYWVKSQLGYTVKCTRVGFLDPTRDNNHISEVALDGYPFDFVIEAQEGDLSELTNGAIEVFEAIVAHLTPTNSDESITVPTAA